MSTSVRERLKRWFGGGVLAKRYGKRGRKRVKKRENFIERAAERVVHNLEETAAAPVDVLKKIV